MTIDIDLYKHFIDELVARRSSVDARRVMEGDEWPNSEENQAVNDFIGSLRPEQRATLAEMLQAARDSGIHDVLAYLSEQINLDEMRVVKGDVALPVQPFGTDLHYDWVCRKEGDDWPKPE